MTTGCTGQGLQQTPLAVLLLEDSAFDAELLREALLRFCPRATLHIACDGPGFEALLAQGGFDVILSDHSLGAYDGLSALALAREKAPYVPFIFVSGIVGEDNVAELIRSGANDYVSKGRLARLPLVLERALREVQERRSRAQAEAALGIARVETERLAAALTVREEELSAGEARFKAAAEAGGIGIWQLDLATQQLYASDHCKRNFGRDVALGFPYAELLAAVHPHDQQRMQSAVAHTVATGEDYRIEYRILRPDGQLAWVRVMGRLEYDADGRPVRMTGISQEITDTMLARRRGELLEYLDSRVYRARSGLADIAYGAAEALGRTLEVTRAGYGLVDPVAESITIERDWTADDAHSTTLEGRFRFGDFGAYFEDLKRGETVVLADACTDPRTRDKAEALMRIGARAFINVPVSEGGQLVAVLYLAQATERYWTAEEIGLVREVAHKTRHAIERRRAEEKLHALANSLELQVQQRTAELMKSEAELRQSQKMEAVGQLTGGLAHDFNNLLGAISGSLELLKRRMGHEDIVARYVDVAQTATRRAAALTHRLLAFSRRQTLEPKVVDVNQLIGGFEDLVRRTIGPQVALAVQAGTGVWCVHADPSQLENALLNLCINARDAMPDGGRLRIETANLAVDAHTARVEEMSPGQYVAISVSDDGCGMPAEVLARAFDPFFTTKPIGLGTGLGLSMVYGFARQSGGQVRIDSVVGAGTAVRLLLPRHLGEAPAAVVPAMAGQALQNVGLGETILVVDDEAAMRTLMAEVLQEMGYRVLQAAHGGQALERLQAEREVALLVTDVGLPGGMNGRQVADAARTLRPDLQILFVTGYAETAVLSHGQLPPGMQILTKPFAIQQFAQKVVALVRPRPHG
ncbi:response regulator [uncultured Pseudacidovorax sp.]|uniref:response regulator n=1 Tax=uncultured Pseudacidovorax sp. TaxID=679313 RepID=UPI0025F2CBB7|nr:response regulator [uncultured Pseudacidovorax sp.]